MRVLVIAALCSFILLAGCGQKGPLYLPQDPISDNSEQAATRDKENRKASTAGNLPD